MDEKERERERTVNEKKKRSVRAHPNMWYDPHLSPPSLARKVRRSRREVYSLALRIWCQTMKIDFKILALIWNFMSNKRKRLLSRDFVTTSPSDWGWAGVPIRAINFPEVSEPFAGVISDLPNLDAFPGEGNLQGMSASAYSCACQLIRRIKDVRAILLINIHIWIEGCRCWLSQTQLKLAALLTLSTKHSHQKNLFQKLHSLNVKPKPFKNEENKKLKQI